jgi:peroxiredoxin
MNRKTRITANILLVLTVLVTNTLMPVNQTFAENCTMEFRKNSKVAFVCEKGYKLDVAPFESEGAFYLALRFFFERFETEVSWMNKTAAVSFGQSQANISANGDFANLNGSNYRLSKKPVIKNGRMFLASTDMEMISGMIGIHAGFSAKSGTVSVSIDKTLIKYKWIDFTRPILGGNGKTLTLSKVLAEPDTKVVIVQIWHTACAGCVDVLKLFETMWQKYQGKGLKIVSINTDGIGFEDARDERIENTGVTYQICSDPEYLLKPEWYDPIFPNYYVIVPGEKYIRIFQERWDPGANATFEKTIDDLCSGN